MIHLEPQYVTSVSKTMAGVTETIVTDTMFVQSVRIDFASGAIYAIILRGTINGGQFVENMSPLEICVNPDGSFVQTNDVDGWSGTVAPAPALVAQLRATFDQFILASGEVTGTTI